MVSLNRVLIAGRLTKKPQMRKTPSGIPVTDLFIALNREFFTLTGEKQQEVCFVDVVVWGNQAVSCCKYLDCSSSVMIEGRLQLDVWYGKDGEKRSKIRVAADKVQFLDKRLTLHESNEEEKSVCYEGDSPNEQEHEKNPGHEEEIYAH